MSNYKSAKKLQLNSTNKKRVVDAASLKELDSILKSSFSAIKKDMLHLQETQHQHLLNLNEAKEALLNSKSDFVTIDKFNVIKIKIGELNENMKKLWELDKKLEEINSNKVSESDFDDQSSSIENELEKLRQDMAELKNGATNESQLNILVEDINNEFDTIKANLEDMRVIKDSITNGDLNKKTDELSEELEDVRSEVSDLRSEVAKDIELEFSEIRKDITSVQNSLKDISKSEDIKNERKRISAEISELKSQQSKLISKDQVDTLINDINVEFDDIKTKLAENEKNLKKNLKPLVNKEHLKTRLSHFEDKFSELKKEGLRLKVVEKSLEKDFLKADHVKALIDDINIEFNLLKEEIQTTNSTILGLKSRLVSKKDIKDQWKEFKNSIVNQDKELSSLKKEILRQKSDFEKNGLTKAQAEHLIDDINTEFDSVRKNITSNANDIDTIRKITIRTLKGYVQQKQFKEELGNLGKTVEDLQTEIKIGLVSNNKFNKINSYFKKTIHSIEADYVSRAKFDTLLDEVERLKMIVKHSHFGNGDVDVKIAKLKAKKGANLEKLRAPNRVTPYRKSYFIGNFLIGGAFLLLVMSITLFFMGKQNITDKLAILSVASFILGLIVRIIVIVKRTKLVRRQQIVE